jgi:hypothetical protein
MLSHEQVKELKEELEKLHENVIVPYYEQKALLKREYKLKRAVQKSTTAPQRERYEDIEQLLRGHDIASERCNR